VKRLRVLALAHEGFVPPAGATAEQARAADWRAEFDVIECLRGLGHDVQVLAVGGTLDPIRAALAEFRPDISFNLLESFDDVAHWDQNVVAYLELQRARYTGCNARGMMLGRDKALTKKLLAFHRIRVADFAVARRGRPFRRASGLMSVGMRAVRASARSRRCRATWQSLATGTRGDRPDHACRRSRRSSRWAWHPSRASRAAVRAWNVCRRLIIASSPHRLIGSIGRTAQALRPACRPSRQRSEQQWPGCHVAPACRG